MTIRVIDATADTDPRVYGGGMTPEGIILHATASKNEAGDQAWLQHYHDNPVSTHQLVRRDGTIVQLVPMNRVAWHAGVSRLNGRGDCNSYCIGIEICNDNAGEAYTDAQYESVAQTVAYNTARFRIPDNWVATHAAVALPAGRKTDPKGFDLARLWNRVWAIRGAWPYGDVRLWVCTNQ